MPRGFWTGLLKVVAFFGVVGGIAVAVLRTWFVDVVTVAHNGMAPTMILGDRVLVWRGARIARNDIVLCRHPRDATRWVIGRVAVEPGGSIEVQRGGLVLGGRRVTQDHRSPVQFTDAETGRTERMSWGIEEFSDYQTHFFFQPVSRQLDLRPMANVSGYYLLGDNRGHVGEDSRAFGVVNPESCRGVVFMRLSAADGLPDEIPHGALDILD